MIDYMKKNKPLVFVVNCDWRDIFRTEQEEFKDKIKRDHLGLDQNNFFYLSFSHSKYESKFDNFTTLHIKTGRRIIKPLIDLRSLWSVVKVILHKRLKPDIYLTYDFGFLPSLWLARKIFGGRVVMVLTNQPRIYSGTRKFGQIKYLYSAFLEKYFNFIPDYFMTINETMKSYLVNLGVSEDKIFIFSTDTINRDQEFINKAQKGRVKDKLGLSSETKIILSVGRLESEKNYHHLIKLFSHLPKNYVLIILGNGSQFSSLVELSKQLGVQDRLFFEGFVNRQEIWDYYSDADIFVLLSKAEALGMVFWEAMFMGVPVLGSSVSGIIETIGHDGFRGKLLEKSDNIEEFTEKVFFCIGDSVEKNSMIQEAKKFVSDKIKNEIVLNKFIK